VLWDGGEALVQEELEGEVVGADGEWSRPNIRPLVPHGFHQADELTLIGSQLGMLGSHGVESP
jgi:hypothetical protein